ncbi:MAG: hypothetical protein AMK73_00195 [Planctomycetes bacterium SM23_32]|nr:MAG: hypothetical protein AMK73_00195 [Planctomycetes bacterium SM23_32]
MAVGPRAGAAYNLFETEEEMDKKHVDVKMMKTGKASAGQCKTHKEVVAVECPVSKQLAAEILGISVDTLDQWTARYGIPHLKYDMDGNRGNRGKVLYLPSDLLAFRERYRVEGRDIEREVEEMLRDKERS